LFAAAAPSPPARARSCSRLHPLAAFDGAKRGCEESLQRRRKRDAGTGRTLTATPPPPPPPLGFFASLPLAPLLPEATEYTSGVDPLAEAAAAEAEERLRGSAALYSALMRGGADGTGRHPHTAAWL
jgi:hypothetical protein